MIKSCFDFNHFCLNPNLPDYNINRISIFEALWLAFSSDFHVTIKGGLSRIIPESSGSP